MRKLAVLLLAIGVLGCGGGDDDDTTPDSSVSTGDSSTSTGNVGWAGCGTGTPFMDMTSAGASRSITITGVPSYSPKCIRVKMGQSVMIESELAHPLTAAATGNPAGSPIVNSPSGPLNVTMNVLGVHGWHCGNHGTPSGGGMSAAIEVVP